MKMFIVEKENGLYGVSELYVVVNAELAELYKESIVPASMSIIDAMSNIPKVKQVVDHSGSGSGYESFYGSKIFGVFAELSTARKFVDDFKDFELKKCDTVMEEPYKSFGAATIMPERLFEKWIRCAYYPMRADGGMMGLYYIPERRTYAWLSYTDTYRRARSRTYYAPNKWMFFPKSK